MLSVLQGSGCDCEAWWQQRLVCRGGRASTFENNVDGENGHEANGKNGIMSPTSDSRSILKLVHVRTVLLYIAWNLRRSAVRK